MATTTNYGWTTPDDTALVKDGASAIRTLGSSVDTTTKNLNPSTTLGDIEYRSSTANTNTRLAIGSTGNVLTVSGGVPAWVAPAGGGKVLQVVQGTYSTAVTVASNTYTDTGLSLSITPTSATSKILVTINQVMKISRSSSDNGASIQIVRGASSVFALGSDDAWYYYFGNNTAVDANTVGSLTYLDSPATTSATTYKTQGRSLRTTSSAQVIFQPDSNKTSVITLMEIGA